MSSTVHSIEAIEAILRRGAMPRTDNRDALIALGFERATPGDDDRGESLWERSVDHVHRAANGAKLLVRERALLETAPHRREADAA